MLPPHFFYPPTTITTPPDDIIARSIDFIQVRFSSHTRTEEGAMYEQWVEHQSMTYDHRTFWHNEWWLLLSGVVLWNSETQRNRTLHKVGSISSACTWCRGRGLLYHLVPRYIVGCGIERNVWSWVTRTCNQRTIVMLCKIIFSSIYTHSIIHYWYCKEHILFPP